MKKIELTIPKGKPRKKWAPTEKIHKLKKNRAKERQQAIKASLQGD